MLAVAIALSAAVLSGCGGGPAPQPDTTTVGEAFQEAHPDGSIPPGLTGIEASRAEIAVRVAAVAGRPVALPRWLPEGYQLAAPYIAVGDGSVRPNPEAWGDSYRISYTDGRGLLVLTVGAKSRPAGLEWRRLDETLRGRPLLAAVSGETATVLSGDRPLLVVTGERLALESVVRVMQSIAPSD